ncbi:MAG: protein kinase, partial [Xanthomonadales bacterium]|nr:protein kinase [Xanthomonadales bacterium]
MNHAHSAADRWQAIWSTFHAALEVSGRDRRALVQARLPADPDAAEEVWRLLRAHATGRSPLDRPALTLLGSSALPEQVGPWRLIRVLGEGGMGAVALASRSDGDYEQLAAIKFIDVSADSARIFEAERRALARLRHPHIAQFYDSGRLDGGLHYLVLEYVEGERLDSWVSRTIPSLDVRLQLLASICRAIHFAHGHLIVHLDLKPANVLVT